MGEAFIVRKGGVAVERTTAPSINFVSKTDSEIVVTFTNNDAAEAEVYYGITSTLTDTVTLAAAATSSNITFSGLDDDTAFTVSAYALVTDPTSKKIKSEIVTSIITTDPALYALDFDGTDDKVVVGTNNTTGDVKRFEIVFTPGKDYSGTGNVGALVSGTTFTDFTIGVGNFTSTFSTETITINFSNSFTFYAAGTFDTGVTYTVVGTWNGTNNYNVTVNGGSNVSILGGTQSSIGDSANFKAFGLREAGNDIFYDGTIQFFKLTNTSDVDILEYLFDEGTGTTLNDNIGTSDMTITGATWVTR